MTEDPFYASDDDQELTETQEESLALREYAGLSLDGFRSMGLRELTTLVIEKTMLTKVILRELARSPRHHDPAAGETLIRAYREGRAEPWLTAWFLPLVQAEGGYAVAREILLAAPGAQAEEYAASAMLSFDRHAACSDLLDIVLEDKAHLRSRRYARMALSGLSDHRIIPTIVDAVRGGRVGRARAAAVLRGQPLTTEQLVSWLDSKDDPMANVAFDVASSQARIELSLAKAMQAALLAGRIEINRGERRNIEERLARLL
jgi:hypothetical protein